MYAIRSYYVFDPDTPEVFATAERLRNEYVLQVRGRVRRRPEGTVNPELATGEIEVLGQVLEVLNAADSFATTLFGLRPEQVPSVVAGARRGLGIMDLDKVKRV